MHAVGDDLSTVRHTPRHSVRARTDTKNNILLDVPQHIFRARHRQSINKASKFVLRKIYSIIAGVYSQDVHANCVHHKPIYKHNDDVRTPPAFSPHSVPSYANFALQSRSQSSLHRSLQEALSVDTPLHILRQIYSSVSELPINSRPPDTN